MVTSKKIFNAYKKFLENEGLKIDGDNQWIHGHFSRHFKKITGISPSKYLGDTVYRGVKLIKQK